MLKLNNKMNRLGAYMSASLVTGMMADSGTADAATTVNSMASRIVAQTSNLTGLITTLGYITGLVFAVLGLLGIKKHVESPQNEPLKNGAIKLLIGAGLFTLPVLSEGLVDLFGDKGAGVVAQNMQGLTKFNTVK